MQLNRSEPMQTLTHGAAGDERSRAHDNPVLRKTYISLLLLAGLASVLMILFLTLDVSDWAFALPRRGRRLLAIVLVGFAISYSTLLFQTITNNRILTPSIIGFDSLYLLIQTVIVFLFGGMTLVMLDRTTHFLINVGLMILLAGALFRWLFQREGRNLYFLILIGVIFGTFFSSFSNFLQMILDPNEFSILQDRMFTSFNNVDQQLLWVSVLCIGVATAYSWRLADNLDVLALGRDQAINLGVDHAWVVNRLMWVIAVMVAVSTALVGPITFFGLLVVNLTYGALPTYRHRYLIPGAALLGVIALVGGQLLVERVFTFSTSLSVIINFLGGLYFLYLLLKESQA
jgi:iron complex transport system permease protein